MKNRLPTIIGNGRSRVKWKGRDPSEVRRGEWSGKCMKVVGIGIDRPADRSYSGEIRSERTQ
jgi:hypothetical protein